MVAQVSDNAHGSSVFKNYDGTGSGRYVPNEPGSCFCVLGIEELDKVDLTEPRDAIWQHHLHSILPHQCTSAVIQRVSAPVDAVWSIVRRFDAPQLYKRFVRSCVMTGDGKVGSLRHYTVVSGLPASSSTERLEILDDEKHIISFKIIGGEHRLQNYCSVTTLHQYKKEGSVGTLVVESYVVDVPEGNTTEETCTFTNTLLRCNLQSLAKLAEEIYSLNGKAIAKLPLNHKSMLRDSADRWESVLN